MSVRPAAAEPARFRKGPYLQNVTTSSITLVWESEQPLPAVVEILSPPGRPPIQVAADEVHEVVIDHLESGHRYRYAVTMAGSRVQGEFATAPPAGAPFSFIVFGDSRGEGRGPTSAWSTASGARCRTSCSAPATW